MATAAGTEDAVFAALAEPMRRRLLRLVGEHDGATATQLAEMVPVTRQAVHKHLTSLEAAGLVKGARTGREVRYGLRPAPLSEAMAWMTTVGAQWDARLAALARQFEEG